MVITEEIDLTLESDFASEYNKWLKPVRVRVREDSSLFREDQLPVLTGLIAHITLKNNFFTDHHDRDSFIFSLYDSYINILGEDRRAMSIVHEADPYAAYFLGGITCDCCGVELNLLNSNGYSLCQKCSVRVNTQMKLN